MLIRRGYRFKIRKPSAEIRARVARDAGCRRHVWNRALAIQIPGWIRGPSPELSPAVSSPDRPAASSRHALAGGVVRQRRATGPRGSVSGVRPVLPADPGVPRVPPQGCARLLQVSQSGAVPAG
ncbi:MAG: helix-turn-helix domain-containing protein [Deltaproteobacteria bacterium]|nr:helix-turn-helix domain-containing protein [Deltaproteobacteria bacterium]